MDHADRLKPTRRSVILSAVGIAIAARASASRTGESIGAIRWDAWYETNDAQERLSVESTLGLPTYRDRAPSCAVVSGDKISVAACGTAANIDAEILAAHAAKLDYWAYCWYGATNRMQEAWKLHQSSRFKSKVKWCLLYSSCQLFQAEVKSAQDSVALLSYLTQNNYQHVHVSGVRRPLLYILFEASDTTNASEAITALRLACAAARIATPYVVILGSGPSTTPGAAVEAGADAVGVYAFSTAVDAGLYQALASTVEANWKAIAKTDQDMIPTAMTGWDRRPRVERPVPWEASSSAVDARINDYYVHGSPAEIALHVAAMITWIGANESACPAQTGLIYSWNEHDEGGSTLNPSLGTGDAILDAVGRVL
jgi:hypothetical protein